MHLARKILPVVLFAWAGGHAFAADQPKRPNILFAFADDWGRHASIYAHGRGNRRRNYRSRECSMNHHRQIQNLRRTRDLLLPRLLSGQLELETEAA